jgi:GTPase SAR1 family protein
MGNLFKKKKKQTQSNLNYNPQPQEQYEEPEWMKHAIPVTRKDTSGRIALLFYGPCHSGKSSLFKYLEELKGFESKGAMIGVAYLKRPETINGKEVFVDSYDIGSYAGNENRKAWFIERCNLFIVVFDPTLEDGMQDLTDCIDNIKNRNNKDPYNICLVATKMDLINDDNKKFLNEVEKNFTEYKLYKLSNNSGEDIKKMYDEFLEQSYDNIKDTLHGIDDLDVMC